jgi:hypothetical protein
VLRKVCRRCYRRYSLELQGEGGAAMCVGRRCCEHWSPLLCGAVTGAARKAVAVLVLCEVVSNARKAAGATCIGNNATCGGRWCSKLRVVVLATAGKVAAKVWRRCYRQWAPLFSTFAKYKLQQRHYNSIFLVLQLFSAFATLL